MSNHFDRKTDYTKIKDNGKQKGEERKTLSTDKIMGYKPKDTTDVVTRVEENFKARLAADSSIRNDPDARANAIFDSYKEVLTEQEQLNFILENGFVKLMQKSLESIIGGAKHGEQVIQSEQAKVPIERPLMQNETINETYLKSDLANKGDSKLLREKARNALLGQDDKHTRNLANNAYQALSTRYETAKQYGDEEAMGYWKRLGKSFGTLVYLLSIDGIGSSKQDDERVKKALSFIKDHKERERSSPAKHNAYNHSSIKHFVKIINENSDVKTYLSS